MSEHDDLSIRGFFGQPRGHSSPPPVVEGGDGVIEYDGGSVRRESEFCEEPGEGDHTLFALAEHAGHDSLLVHDVREGEAGVGGAATGAGLVEHDLEVFAAQADEFLVETCGERFGDVLSGERLADAGDRGGATVLLGLLALFDAQQAFDRGLDRGGSGQMKGLAILEFVHRSDGLGHHA